MRRFVSTAIRFLLLLMLLLFAADCYFRERAANSWFNGLIKKAREPEFSCKYLFLGNSMVAAAVDAERFAKLANKSLGKNFTGINLGKGNSTTVEFLYGFKKLVAANKTCLKDANIFIGAPGGLPRTDYWDQNWMNPTQPALLADYIDDPGIDQYMKLRVPLGNKAALLASKFSVIAGNGPQIQILVIDAIDRALDSLFPLKPADVPDLEPLAGIAANRGRLLPVRAQAIAETKGAIPLQKPIDWQRTVLKDLVDYLKSHGARVYLLNIPISPLTRAVVETPIRQRDLAALKEFAKNWQCSIVASNVDYDETDFPDVYHLRGSLRAEFTDSIAREFLSKKLELPQQAHSPEKAP